MPATTRALPPITPYAVMRVRVPGSRYDVIRGRLVGSPGRGSVRG